MNYENDIMKKANEMYVLSKSLFGNVNPEYYSYYNKQPTVMRDFYKYNGIIKTDFVIYNPYADSTAIYQLDQFTVAKKHDDMYRIVDPSPEGFGNGEWCGKVIGQVDDSDKSNNTRKRFTHLLTFKDTFDYDNKDKNKIKICRMNRVNLITEQYILKKDQIETGVNDSLSVKDVNFINKHDIWFDFEKDTKMHSPSNKDNTGFTLNIQGNSTFHCVRDDKSENNVEIKLDRKLHLANYNNQPLYVSVLFLLSASTPVIRISRDDHIFSDDFIKDINELEDEKGYIYNSMSEKVHVFETEKQIKFDDDVVMMKPSARYNAYIEQFKNRLV